MKGPPRAVAGRPPRRSRHADGGDHAFLLDVNVLIALAWPNHIHHPAALSWFEAVGRRGFATCPVTQAGFVRVSSNIRAIPNARSPREARDLLRRITDLPTHRFWSDDTDLSRSEHIAWERLGNHAQVTDAHILAIALRKGGPLATFDRAVADLVPEGAPGNAVILIPA
jgi:toxin-antitoxin system PIN domain toxin